MESDKKHTPEKDSVQIPLGKAQVQDTSQRYMAKLRIGRFWLIPFIVMIVLLVSMAAVYRWLLANYSFDRESAIRIVEVMIEACIMVMSLTPIGFSQTLDQTNKTFATAASHNTTLSEYKTRVDRAHNILSVRSERISEEGPILTSACKAIDDARKQVERVRRSGKEQQKLWLLVCMLIWLMQIYILVECVLFLAKANTITDPAGFAVIVNENVDHLANLIVDHLFFE